MRIKLLVATLLFVLASSTSFAMEVYWDLSGVGVTGVPVAFGGDADDLTGLFEELTFYSETTVTQYDSDGDFVTSVGDFFTDVGSISATGMVPINVDTEGINLVYEVTGTLDNMSGIVTKVELDPLTGDTRVDYKYTAGSFSLYIDQPKDADFATRGEFDDVGFSDGTKIATFNLLNGIGHTFIDFDGGDVENQGSGEFYLEATELVQDFWFNEAGEDLADVFNDIDTPLEWFVAFTDYNVDDPILTPGVLGQDDYLFTLDVTHDGSVEFGAVPEPSTFLLLGGGLLGLGFYARRKKQ